MLDFLGPPGRPGKLTRALHKSQLTPFPGASKTRVNALMALHRIRETGIDTGGWRTQRANPCQILTIFRFA
jgi:hypothetical protein